MDPGKLKHRITIQEPTVVNTKGQITQTWSTVKIVMAAIEPLSGRQLWQARQVTADVTHRICIRYLAGLTAAMRIIYGDRTFAITSVFTPSEKRRDTVIMAVEQV